MKVWDYFFQKVTFYPIIQLYPYKRFWTYPHIQLYSPYMYSPWLPFLMSGCWHLTYNYSIFIDLCALRAPNQSYLNYVNPIKPLWPWESQKLYITIKVVELSHFHYMRSRSFHFFKYIGFEPTIFSFLEEMPYQLSKYYYMSKMCLLSGFINFWSTKYHTPHASVFFNFHGFSRFLPFEQNSFKLIKNPYVSQLGSYIYCSHLIISLYWISLFTVPSFCILH